MDLGNQRSFRPLDSEQVPVAQHHKNIDENGKARPVLLQPYPPSVTRAEGFEYTSNRDPCERCIGYIAKGFIHKNMNWTSPQHVWIEAVCEHVKAGELMFIPTTYVATPANAHVCWQTLKSAADASVSLELPMPSVKFSDLSTEGVQGVPQEAQGCR
jgi:hypothetical protein